MSNVVTTGAVSRLGTADLHLHSTFSDGTFSPEEVALRATQAGLSAVSLTDHDTLEGWPRFEAACRSHGLQAISGVELTAEIDDQELHLLGYGLNVHDTALAAATRQFQEVRRRRIVEMVERLHQLNIPLTIEAVLQLANCHSPGRPHVARALVAAGICHSLDEAFERFLKRDRPAWVPKFKISAHGAIALIHSAGGLAVLAHPALNRIDHHIPELARHGLDGLECFHTKHSSQAEQHYLKLAAHLGLLTTGGSDCHGLNKGKPLIGTVRLDAHRLDAFQARLRQCHADQQVAIDTRALTP